ncbi:MAG: hypothetical protein ACI4F0_03115 [Agathobacter sp.]
MFDTRNRFVIENYQRKPEFSSFLPGISGVKGIPLWSFYVNRGQAICSFGSCDKEHSIMEFYPAEQSYRLVKKFGFRTMLKVDGTYVEAFQRNDSSTRMYIGMNEMEIEEFLEREGIKVNVLYFILPEEKVGGLVRRVTISNISQEKKYVEIVDGMPSVIPYGISLTDYKEMAQTMKAWMQVEDVEEKMPYYRVRYSTKDSASVTKIEEGNFFLAFDEAGELLPVIGDPTVVFGYDTAFDDPVNFGRYGVSGLRQKKQICQNQVPSAFATACVMLDPGESTIITELIGQAACKEMVHLMAQICRETGYFEAKHCVAQRLTKELSDVIGTKTGSKVFDGYCRQTFIDNVLRGGSPIQLSEHNIFYVYSRKHGDLERDYNFFRMPAEYYSQGNGNYRDVNQNRRNDVLFYPMTQDYNLKLFYSLLQLDGYNPLIIREVTYRVCNIDEALSGVNEKSRKILKDHLGNDFTPGSLLRFMEENHIGSVVDREQILKKVIECSKAQIHAEFGEGYWTDHWTYNLDLLENYLSVYPDREREVLFEDYGYTYYHSGIMVLPRNRRYVRTEKGLRQYRFLDIPQENENSGHIICKQHGKGEEYHSNLWAKLVVLALNKFSSLDICGMGIEMEAGKPGWYDALNGLPAFFGSSMAETYELKRMLEFMAEKAAQYKISVQLPKEVIDFWNAVKQAIHTRQAGDGLVLWNRMNRAKEQYRKTIQKGINGEEDWVASEELTEEFRLWLSVLTEGIEHAVEENDGVPPTYFRYEIQDYEEAGDDIHFINADRKRMPDFLEGAVHYMKLLKSAEKKGNMYNAVKNSNLYDSGLHMYKVNESLEEAPFEVGRAKAFCPGWLENESIWLHMEYKYLLELLKGGLYAEFMEDFEKACVAFLNPDIYGRSPLENVSFIASSVNSCEAVRGRGFVARLSGSTAEFLQMWQIMMFGKKPIREQAGELCCKWEPVIPAYLIGDEKKITAMYAGYLPVTYELNGVKDYYPGNYRIKKQRVEYINGKEKMFEDFLPQEVVGEIRCKTVKAVRVWLDEK